MYNKEVCQEIFVEPKVFAVSRSVAGLTLADMEAIFGRLSRQDFMSGADGSISVESEDLERTRVFNFAEFPITKVSQDGARYTLPCYPVLDYVAAMRVTYGAVIATPLWWSALCKTQEQSSDLVDKIIIARARIYCGANMAEIRNQMRNSLLDDKTIESLLASKTFTAYSGGKKKVAIYAMFMFVVGVDNFKGYIHLHERCSDTFVSLADTIEAPAHPFDASNALIDMRAMGSEGKNRGTMSLTGYRYVYHDNVPRTRYMREGSKVVELVPIRDRTTQEGVYTAHYRPIRPDGTPGDIKRDFFPLEAITEEKGFYLTREGAEQCKSEKELQALQQQRSQESEQMLKAWISALQADTKNSSAYYKDCRAACLDTLRKSLEQKQDAFDSQLSALIKEKQQLNEQLKAAKADAEQRKREHEERMLERKELLESLKLIPAVLAVVGTVMAFGQKGKKK